MFHCSHCDSQHLKWQGRCGECGKWGTLSEESTGQTSKRKNKGGAKAAPVLDLTKTQSGSHARVKTGIDELDRVLSGGLVPGSVTLLAGEPGIGKSTLVAELASTFNPAGRIQEKVPTLEKNSSKSPIRPRGSTGGSRAYYASGEESEGQVLMRFGRLDIDPSSISFSNATEVGSIIAAAEKLKPSMLIVDSIQTMIPEEVDTLPGSPSSVRAATAQLIGYAKSSNVPVVIIGQVTKEGSIAGPKTLEHLVDTLLTLEGDRSAMYRILRASKNRFGSTDEVGIFEMTSTGMKAVLNPSARFLEERAPGSGSVVTCVMEGTRPLLVEIQALAEKSLYANPIRRTSGFDPSRLQMLLAIIGKRAGVATSGQDIYVNVVGGMKIKETAADLAVCAAIISSITDKPVDQQTVVIGELGLGGEVRSVPFLDRRLKEASRLGLENSLSPKTTKHIKDLR